MCPYCNNTPFELLAEYNMCPICKWEDNPIHPNILIILEVLIQ
ncbi:CPCC family cysteine-rich protein [Xenorhabdus sp. Sc-CR9]